MEGFMSSTDDDAVIPNCRAQEAGFDNGGRPSPRESSDAAVPPIVDIRKVDSPTTSPLLSPTQPSQLVFARSLDCLY